MYTLISHGSRIQVAQFHLFNAFGGETPDIADSKKVIDSNTAQEQLRIAENNKRNQEEVKK